MYSWRPCISSFPNATIERLWLPIRHHARRVGDDESKRANVLMCGEQNARPVKRAPQPPTNHDKNHRTLLRLVQRRAPVASATLGEGRQRHSRARTAAVANPRVGLAGSESPAPHPNKHVRVSCAVGHTIKFLDGGGTPSGAPPAVAPAPKHSSAKDSSCSFEPIELRDEHWYTSVPLAANRASCASEHSARFTACSPKLCSAAPEWRPGTDAMRRARAAEKSKRDTSAKAARAEALESGHRVQSRYRAACRRNRWSPGWPPS